MNAALKPELLFVIGDRKPVFDQLNARTNEHSLEFGNGAEEFLVFFVGAKTHDSFDTSPVVPAAIKQHDFASRWKMRGITLKIPLGPLTAVRGG
jgi:hypothetical protein